MVTRPRFDPKKIILLRQVGFFGLPANFTQCFSLVTYKIPQIELLGEASSLLVSMN